MANTVYALLAERAEANDRAELFLAPHTEDKRRPDLARNREELDVWLVQPVGKQALAEQALIRELGGGK